MEEQVIIQAAKHPSENVAVLDSRGENSSGDDHAHHQPDQQLQQQQQPATYGPFHRLRSPTQSDETAQRQVKSQEVWGRPRRGSDIPQVQAYVGPLPTTTTEKKGIEFYTNVPPDPHQPPGQARWTGPRPGVIVQEEEENGLLFARIAVVITKNTQQVSSSSMEPDDEKRAEPSSTGLENEEASDDYVMVA